MQALSFTYTLSAGQQMDELSWKGSKLRWTLSVSLPLNVGPCTVTLQHKTLHLFYLCCLCTVIWPWYKIPRACVQNQTTSYAESLSFKHTTRTETCNTAAKWPDGKSSSKLTPASMAYVTWYAPINVSNFIVTVFLNNQGIIHCMFKMIFFYVCDITSYSKE